MLSGKNSPTYDGDFALAHFEAGGVPHDIIIYGRQQAELSAGDIIIAIDGLRAAKHNLEPLITAWPVGSTVTVHAFRRDELMTFEVTLQASPDDTCVFTLDHKADEATLARRCSWLGQTG